MRLWTTIIWPAGCPNSVYCFDDNRLCHLGLEQVESPLVNKGGKFDMAPWLSGEINIEVGRSTASGCKRHEWKQRMLQAKEESFPQVGALPS